MSHWIERWCQRAWCFLNILVPGRYSLFDEPLHACIGDIQCDVHTCVHSFVLFDSVDDQQTFVHISLDQVVVSADLVFSKHCGTGEIPILQRTFHTSLQRCSVVECSRMHPFIQSFDSTLSEIQLEALLRRISLLITSSILLHRLFRSTLVLLEVLDLIRTHVFSHLVGLELLEAKTSPLVAVVLVICPTTVSKVYDSILSG
jgi:hypothetical protein